MVHRCCHEGYNLGDEKWKGRRVQEQEEEEQFQDAGVKP